MITKQDITLCEGRVKGTRWRLYYYMGNFYHPLFLPIKEMTRVRFLIEKFKSNHRQLIKEDRELPGYKNLLELFDEQIGT